MPLLEVLGVDVLYGNVRAIQGVSLSVEAGKIVTLIGANGAGKSTTLNAICGVLPISRGAIRFKGEEISGLSPHAIVRLGISQVPEGRRIFGRLTVSENITLGSFVRHDRREIERDRERVLELFPRLRERLGQTELLRERQRALELRGRSFVVAREDQKASELSGSCRDVGRRGGSRLAEDVVEHPRAANDGGRARPVGRHLEHAGLRHHSAAHAAGGQ